MKLYSLNAQNRPSWIPVSCTVLAVSTLASAAFAKEAFDKISNGRKVKRKLIRDSSIIKGKKGLYFIQFC